MVRGFVGKLVVALAAPLVSQALMLSPSEEDGVDGILFGTMTFPEDTLPIDITVAHQVRMITKSPEKVRTVVVDNRPPWMSQKTSQGDILKMMQATGQADIMRMSYDNHYDEPKYLQKFFNTSNAKNSTKSLEKATDRSDISGQHMSSNTYGMFAFLDKCLRSEDVSICLFLDPDIILHRDGLGMADLAKAAFKENPKLIALNPPTLCYFDKPDSKDKEPVGLRALGLLSQRYLIVHRERLIKALPLQVPHSEFNVNFEHLFHIGMKNHGADSAKRLTCGHTFAIHPFSNRWAHCLNKKENLNIVTHAKIVGSRPGETIEPSHYGFEPDLVNGLRELLRRVEKGLFPKPEDPTSVTNQCEDMCPDTTRIANGLAW